MISIITADGAAEQTQLKAMAARAAAQSEDIVQTVQVVMAAVQAEGFAAVERYTRQFDHAVPCEIPPEALAEAYDACPPALVAALEHAARNIRDYNQRLIKKSAEWPSPDGGMVGRILRPLDRVGVYVPGGTAAYPSSVLMNVVPAKVAGVREVVMVTPPTRNLSMPVLAAAKIAGVDRLIAVGGAQAIAALTYGAGFIPKVDKLVGPGNAYVAAAKRLAYGAVDIDMVAGPSEVLVIADQSAQPHYVAADLLSQAEHDRLASAVLLTDSQELAQRVSEEVERQLAGLERQETIKASLRDFGCAIVCQSLEDCVALANEIAPEHLELVTKNPRALLPLVKNAGAVFLGAYTPEPLGDYLAGPDHVLPTSGTARFFSPLSVDAFLKSMSVLEFSRETLQPLAKEIVTLAEAEGLTAHANSIRVRLEESHSEPS
ncbi:MAG: histidinol dehydrogenase [Lawsonibacter sp.]|nr:histidinol dehydrogenase [Lawsonibacter sp.]MCI8914402.1 histidinol dehydrogenase [Lawsonibacter sp.]